jgi:Ca2+-binding RTX toxin-like protein
LRLEGFRAQLIQEWPLTTEIRLSAGATEKDITDALAQLPSGGTIVLPSHETIDISQGLRINVSNRDITIDLNGSTLQQAGNTSIIWGFGSHKPGQSATLEASAPDTTVVTYAGASALQVGDHVKIYSDDMLPNDQVGGFDPTRLGQALEVLAVDGNTVTLKGELLYREDYQTNVRASAYSSGELVIKNGTIEGDQSQPTWVSDLVNLRTTVDAKIDHLTVQNGNSMGINIIDSVDATVTDAVVKNLRDDPSHGQLGYGVHSAASIGTTVIGLYAEGIRHATDNNSVGVPAGHPNPSRYGADIGMTVVGAITYDPSSFAYSWHSEGRESLVQDSMAFNAPGLLGARGVDNAMVDSYGVNVRHGIQLYEAGEGDGNGFLFDGIHVKEGTVIALSVTENPHDNLVLNSFFEITQDAGDPGTAAALINTSIRSFVTNFDETLAGTAAADVLLGGQGVDLISGGAGGDYIWGGSSIDALAGGSGSDYFAFHRLTDASSI